MSEDSAEYLAPHLPPNAARSRAINELIGLAEAFQSVRSALSAVEAIDDTESITLKRRADGMNESLALVRMWIIELQRGMRDD